MSMIIIIIFLTVSALLVSFTFIAMLLLVSGDTDTAPICFGAEAYGPCAVIEIQSCYRE